MAEHGYAQGFEQMVQRKTVRAMRRAFPKWFLIDELKRAREGLEQWETWASETPMLEAHLPVLHAQVAMLEARVDDPEAFYRGEQEHLSDAFGAAADAGWPASRGRDSTTDLAAVADATRGDLQLWEQVRGMVAEQVRSPSSSPEVLAEGRAKLDSIEADVLPYLRAKVDVWYRAAADPDAFYCLGLPAREEEALEELRRRWDAALDKMF